MQSEAVLRDSARNRDHVSEVSWLWSRSQSLLVQSSLTFARLSTGNDSQWRCAREVVRSPHEFDVKDGQSSKFLIFNHHVACPSVWWWPASTWRRDPCGAGPRAPE